ncbi:dynamin family protein [Colletotrichum karsti]|uniref:Dynamin family protein n=1 Tax=Colletotrichum karsti TaxID=1095194 RepID=A0A9P6HUJ1_9PEZI|nr:dynamin family protein [Colletotrichum karsti]KAF9870993.1 dynamin family protein [Colletotrichum karsti]
MDLEGVRELYSIETRALFDAIDRLSSLGISNVADPPQIVVVGAPSSGKSSVLHAISHSKIPFRCGTLTRFATELALRRGPRPCVRASVRPFDPRQKPVELEVTEIDFKQQCVDSVIAAAEDDMGLDESNETFSNDVLRFEIEGPDIYPLTLIDLPPVPPGEFSDDGTEDDSALPGIFNTYLNNENCIVLAIVSANIPLANQSILPMIAEQGFDQERILGVITKLDLLEPGSPDGQQYTQAVRGRQSTHSLRQGFHVLLNPSTDERPRDVDNVRDDFKVEFFEAESWSSLPIHRCGVSALRKKLNPLIHNHVVRGLPDILGPIQEKLSELRLELKMLGPSRSGSLEKREYLVKLASGFKRLVREGIQGHYNDPFFGGLDGADRKLRSQIQRSHGAIRHILATKGSSNEILDDVEDRPSPPNTPWHLVDFIAANPYGLPFPEPLDREDVVYQLEEQAVAGQNVKPLHQESMNLAVQLFRRQAQPWEKIARIHFEKVTAITKSFVEQVVEHLAGTANTCSTTFSILSTCVDPFFEERQKLLEHKLQELLRPYREGFSMVFDEGFEEDLRRRVSERNAASPDDSSEQESAAEWIIDMMQTFYHMSLRTFTDNLINLAVESCLVHELPGMFTPADVTRMSDARVAELAAETEETQSIRSQLEAEIRLLEDGLKECRRHRPRSVPGHSSRPSTSPRTSPEASPRAETVSPATTLTSVNSTPIKEGETRSIPIRVSPDILKFESKADSIAFPQSIFSFEAEREPHGLEAKAEGIPVQSNILFGGSKLFNQVPTQELTSGRADRSPSVNASRDVGPTGAGNHSDEEIFDADGRHINRIGRRTTAIEEATWKFSRHWDVGHVFVKDGEVGSDL